MAINWGNNSALAGFQNALALGADIGSAIRKGREDSALAAYMTTPGDDTGAALMKINPEMALQAQGLVQQRGAAAAKARQEQDQSGFEGLQRVGRLLDGVSDEQTYQRARMLAQQNGIDVSKVPANYDPDWVNGQREFIQKMQDPKQREALSTAGKQAVDMGYTPGTPEFGKVVQQLWQAGEAKPYVVGGETRLYKPTLSGVKPAQQPVVGMIEDGHRFKGGNPADPSAWEPVAQQEPQMVVTSRELDALVNKFGPDEVQRRIDSGVVAVRN